MAKFDEALLSEVAKAARKHRDDIDHAVQCAERAASKLPGWKDWISDLAKSKLRDLIHGVRHSDNTTMRRDAGMFGGPAKVDLSTGAANRIAGESWFNYFIGGMSLGQVLGSDLKAIAEGERERAEGCIFNARLCEQLAPLVPAEKRVSEAVRESQIKKIVKGLKGKRAA